MSSCLAFKFAPGALAALACIAAMGTARAAKPPAPLAPVYHYINVPDTVYDISNDGIATAYTTRTSTNPAFPCSDPIMTVWNLPSSSPNPPAPVFTDTAVGGSPESSQPRAMTDDASIIIGVAFVADLTSTDTCRRAMGLVAWERAGLNTWVRSWIEAPGASTGPTSVNDVSLVGGAPVVVGKLNGAPVAWRQVGTAWVREAMPLPPGLAAADAEPREVQGDGLALNFPRPGVALGVWDCSGVSCRWLTYLSSAGLSAPAEAYEINEEGDVVGRGVLVGSTRQRALIWRCTWTSGVPSWADPVALPDLGYGANAHASEWVEGVLTVVGRVTTNGRGASDARQWEWTGTSWSSPVKINDLDDASGSFGPAMSDMRPSGHLIGPGTSPVEIRIP